MTETSETLPENDEHVPAFKERNRVARSQVSVWRRVSGWCLIFLTCLGVVCSTLAIWMQAYPLDTDRWVAIATPLGRDPDVTNDLSTYISTQVVKTLKVQQRLAALLPHKDQDSATSLTDALSKYIAEHLDSYFQSASFEQTWIQFNRTAHKDVLAALRGNSSYLLVSGNMLTLNLIPFIIQALASLNQHLPAFFARPLPDLPANATPDEERQALEQALDITLPNDFGQITLLNGRRLLLVQTSVRLSDALAPVLPFVTLALLILALCFLPRRRTIIQLGLGIGLGMLLLCGLELYTTLHGVATLQNEAARPLVGDIVIPEFQSLLVVAALVGCAGLLVAVIAWLTGRSARLLRYIEEE